jgi:hypothetical protein
MNNQAQKKDAGKPQWRLLPWLGTQAVVRILEFGARKYSENGWRSVDNWEKRYFDAAFRHMIAVARGEQFDICPAHKGVRPADCKDCSGEPHLAHAACNLLFLLDLRSEIYHD